MAISKSTPDNIESAARSIFEQKILEKIPDQDSRDALLQLVDGRIDWNYAYSVFSEYFPEIVSDLDGMTLDMIINNLYAYEDDELASGFEQWAEDNQQYYWYLRKNRVLGFDDIVQAISQCMYDYELHDTKEDCDADALKATRRIYR